MNTENKFFLNTGMLYVLSGLPGSGKSTWTKNLPFGMVVSTDAIREQILGVRKTGGIVHHFQEANVAVWNVVSTIVKARLRERLTTVVDAMSLTEADRSDILKLAKEFGVKAEVLIFDCDLETVIERDKARSARVSERRIRQLADTFKRTSEHPYRLVPEGSVPEILLNQLPSTAIDVIGDVHGLFDDLMLLLAKMGYSIVDGVPVHPQGRKLLFLGDVVDRGTQSIEVLQFVRRAVAAGHFMIAGNHERKILQFWDSMQLGETQARSRSSAETCMGLMRLPEDERKQLVDFVRQLPGYYVLHTKEGGGRKLAFTHSNLVHFDPLVTLHTECLYGSEGYAELEGFDTDQVYAGNYAAGDNQYWLLRGHVEATSIQDSVFSLERRQSYAGHLVSVPLDAFVGLSQHMAASRAFEEVVVLQKCEFDYDEHCKRFALFKGLNDLVKNKLAVASMDKSTGCRIYKYSKSVFYEARWGESDFLAKARGIVLDLAGNIVVHPFDKVFNYGERDAGLQIADEQDVIAVEKFNGFLGCISKHPFNKNELLFTTTGSFESDFVEYIKSFVTPALKGRLLKFFSKNDVTLMFEVLHKEDPHIIEYEDSQLGLWLIGARGKTETSDALTEEQLDIIAKELWLPRPKWFVTQFGALKDMVATSKLEGYMVRDVVTQETLLKFKTPYYLVTKFLGRLSANKTKFLYANPKEFKKTLDEEFYDLVDALVANVPQEKFSAMEDTQRTTMVRELIADMR